MELITLLISLLGFPVGMILAKIAYEELDEGQEYFLILRDLILFFGFVFCYDILGLNIKLFLLIGGLTLIVIRDIDIPTPIGYVFLIILFIFNPGLIIAVLLFMYGIVGASLWMKYLPLPKELSIMAHRGASAYGPENTMQAYKKAIVMKSNYIEIDVRITKDGKLIAMHDINMERMTGKYGKINNMTLKELQKNKIKGEEIPLIEEIIKLGINKVKFNFDVKDQNVIEPLIKLIKKNKLEKDVIISSFIIRALLKIKKIDRKINSAYLFKYPTAYMIISKIVDANIIHPHYMGLNKEMVIKARKKGLTVNVWGITNERQARRSAYYYGADGLILDDPKLLKNELKKYDLHIHTKNSACAYLNPETILREAKLKGLDGIAITDHNTMKGAMEVKELNKDKNFEVIIGEEIQTDKGEILALYLKKEIQPGKFEKVVEEIKKQKGIIVIAHPYTLGLFRGPSKLKSFKKIDAIECVNGRCFFKFENLKAQIKAKELQIPCIAGSDAHFYFEIGKCYTEFKGNLLQSIKKKETKAYGTIRYSIIARTLSLVPILWKKLSLK